MIIAFCCSIEADSDLALCSSIPLSYQLPSPNQPNKSHCASIIIGLPLCIVTEPFCSKGTAIRVSKLIGVGSRFCASSADTSAAATALLCVCLDHTPTQIMIIGFTIRPFTWQRASKVAWGNFSHTDFVACLRCSKASALW